jgi:hypothetical protein
MERTYTDDEPDRAAELHRRRDGEGPGLRERSDSLDALLEDATCGIPNLQIF